MEISGKTRASVQSARCYGWVQAQDIAADYLKLLPQLGLEQKLWPWAEDYARYHTGRLLWDVDFLTTSYQFSGCLNIGGAPFIFEYLMKQAHPEIDVVSVDLHPERFPNVEHILGIKVARLDVEQPCAVAAEMIGRFQCVVFCEIFEHLRVDILKTMSFIRSLLGQQGFLYVTMPNGLGIAALLRNILGGRTGPDPIEEWSKLADLGHMGHVREYSYAELRNVLMHCGFRIERYLYRRKAGGSGGLAHRLRDQSQRLLTGLVPQLGNEIVAVARPAALNQSRR